MNPAIIVVDMLNDAFRTKNVSSIVEYLGIIPNIRNLVQEARLHGMPVVYGCDSFLENDFMFQGKKGFCIRGTTGAEVIDELKPVDGDIIVRKRRFSAFFKTFLDQELRTRNIDTVVVTGINTEGCVYSTVMDAVAHDFYGIVLEDCSASLNRRSHELSIDLLSRSRLFPLLRIMTSREFMEHVAKSDSHLER